MKRINIYTKIARFKKLLKWFLEKYQLKCYFCKEIMVWDDILKNRWTLHHKDHNRSNNKPENLELSHRGCHRSYHRKLEEEEIRRKYAEIRNQ